MKVEKIISDLVKPLVLLGTYKDKHVALKDIIVTHIERKVESYNKIIQFLEKKYGMDFDTFTKDIKNKTTLELEEDWMEWRGAIEMQEAWDEALKEVMECEAKV